MGSWWSTLVAAHDEAAEDATHETRSQLRLAASETFVSCVRLFFAPCRTEPMVQVELSREVLARNFDYAKAWVEWYGQTPAHAAHAGEQESAAVRVRYARPLFAAICAVNARYVSRREALAATAMLEPAAAGGDDPPIVLIHPSTAALISEVQGIAQVFSNVVHTGLVEPIRLAANALSHEQMLLLHELVAIERDVALRGPVAIVVAEPGVLAERSEWGAPMDSDTSCEPCASTADLANRATDSAPSTA